METSQLRNSGIDVAVVPNPKRAGTTSSGRVNWYPYYAGFSAEFARSMIASGSLGASSQILDPWNGSGTTSFSAISAGHHVVGFDLNPVMVMAAKAQAISPLSKDSLTPLAAEVISIATRSAETRLPYPDPLSQWLIPESAASFRRIEAAIQFLLVDRHHFVLLNTSSHLDAVSDLASFFYVALFRTVRAILHRFFATNPTWIKQPDSLQSRVRPSFQTIGATFKAEVESMVTDFESEPFGSWPGSIKLAAASSERLPISDETIDFVLTSPPYCTRIDYAVATRLELAILGYAPGRGFEQLRQELMGTSMVPDTVPAKRDEWGLTCSRFLSEVSKHKSKASSSYYLKNHLQYFQTLYRSIKEIGRVTRPGATCVFVVQDSYYKDVHNDLPQIVAEMASANALPERRRVDFQHRRTMAGINPGTKVYRKRPSAIETVLICKKT